MTEDKIQNWLIHHQHAANRVLYDIFLSDNDTGIIEERKIYNLVFHCFKKGARRIGKALARVVSKELITKNDFEGELSRLNKLHMTYDKVETSYPLDEIEDFNKWDWLQGFTYDHYELLRDTSKGTDEYWKNISTRLKRERKGKGTYENGKRTSLRQMIMEKDIRINPVFEKLVIEEQKTHIEKLKLKKFSVVNPSSQSGKKSGNSKSKPIRNDLKALFEEEGKGKRWDEICQKLSREGVFDYQTKTWNESASQLAGTIRVIETRELSLSQRLTIAEIIAIAKTNFGKVINAENVKGETAKKWNWIDLEN